MFHRVCSQVYLQGGSIRVRTVAVVALERFVFVVLPSVGLGGVAAAGRKEKASVRKEASISSGDGFTSNTPKLLAAKEGTPGSQHGDRTSPSPYTLFPLIHTRRLKGRDS